MSFKVGLNDSEQDLQVQGEVDFDFFDEGCERINLASNKHDDSDKGVTDVQEAGDTVTEDTEPNLRKCLTETVIPSPEHYLGNNCESFECTKDNSDGSSASDLSTSISDESYEKYVEDSDSMTDVSSLHSSCTSPNTGQGGNFFEITTDDQESNTPESFDEHDSNPAPTKEKGVRIIESVRTAHHSDVGNADILLKALKTLTVEQIKPKQSSSSSSPLLTPNNNHRKNLTFTNEDVRRIDRENVQLLKKIKVQQNRTKPNVPMSNCKPSSSAVNRQKQQRQIELENMALLKRLKNSKPTASLSCWKLLKEHDNQSSSSSTRTSIRSSRTTSELSSCRSSANSSGRSSAINSQCSRSVKSHSCSAGKVKKQAQENCRTAWK